MISPGARLERGQRPLIMLASLGLLAVIGVIDYVTGFEMLFSVFYLLSVGLATWYVGKWLGLAMSALSAGIWIGGDLAAGAHYSNSVIPIWNTLILMGFYFIVVWLLTHLRALHRELEARVQQRTEALTREIAGRERLEQELLRVSERERQRIGHDLHDSLCQHLTGTALAGQVLSERLESKGMPEARDAARVVELVEGGIELARNLARGLYLVEMDAEGLMAAFQEMAANLTRDARLQCTFECEAPVLLHEPAVATHLYRIAQEAVSNAIRHGNAKHIVISLSERGAVITLAVEDDGVGLPEDWQRNQGLGTRIMAYRASMIGGSLSVEPALTGGTVVTCSLPAARAGKAGNAGPEPAP